MSSSAAGTPVSAVIASSKKSLIETDKRNLCSTNVEPVRMKQEWSIANFAVLMKLCKPGQCLRSQPFAHTAYEDVQWQLCMYPGGKREENKGFVSLFLKMYAPPSKDVALTAEYKLFFMSEANEKKFCNINIGEFHSKCGKKGFGWGLRNLPRLKVQQGLRTDGSLFILCEVEVLPDLSKIPCVSVAKTGISTNCVPIPAKFVSDMKSLLDTGALSDFTILVGSKTFSVHKCVLAAHSEVFRAMFETALSESQSNQMEVKDFTSNAVAELLQYIYSGLSPNVKEYAQDLIGLSEKYGLMELKSLCENELSSRICDENVCELVTLADLYLAQSLKDACIIFIASKKKEVMASEDWQQLKDDNSKLANEILEILLGVGSPSCSSGPPPCKRRKEN